MDQELAKKYGLQMERIGWLISFFGMLTQIGRFSFPSYNCVLGFWGVYSAFSRHGRATFGFITFSFISLLLDIIFCSLNSDEEKFSQYTFALVMFIICMFIKVAGIYTCAHFFSAIGGASAMENDFNNAYDSLSMDNSQINHLQQSQHGTGNGGYYPPQHGLDHHHNSMNDSGHGEADGSL